MTEEEKKEEKNIEYVVVRESRPIVGGRVVNDCVYSDGERTSTHEDHSEALEVADLINRNSRDWSPGHVTTAYVVSREKK